jgi:rhodanese-related sulfurtransferase
VALFDTPGYLLGGGSRAMGTVELEELITLVEHGDVTVVDVREPHELAEGRIPQSINIPYRLLRATSELAPNGPIVTICETGPRAMVAASVLAARGFDARPVAPGGMRDWAAAGLPT